MSAGALLLLAGTTAGTETARWFSIGGDPDFADVRRQLQVLVDAQGRLPQNRLCVVGQAIGTDRQAYVYWRTNRKLILWEPQIANSRAILGSRRYLDLRKDVAENNDVAGSTYRITRRFADAAINACRRIGTNYTIVRHMKLVDG